jgi:hypothetical protein
MIKLISVLLLLAISQGAMSDVVVKRNKKNKTAIVSIEKRIYHEDWQEFVDALNKLDTEGYSLKLNAIVLNSKGGSASTAMAIGRTIRERRLNTYVAPNAYCASACAHVLVGGVTRMAYGRIAVHRARYFEELPIEELEVKLVDLDSKIREYIGEMGVSVLLTEATLQTPNWGIRELTMREKENWGVHANERIFEDMWFRKTAIKNNISFDVLKSVFVDNYERCNNRAKRFETTLLDCVDLASLRK